MLSRPTTRGLAPVLGLLALAACGGSDSAAPATAFSGWTVWPPYLTERAHAAMAYDAGRQRTVLYGGRGNLQWGDDFMWHWDGAGWESKGGWQSPFGAVSEMVYDPVRDRIVGVGFGKTWEWDGEAWEQRDVAALPSSVSELAYDESRGLVVLVSSRDLGGGQWGVSVWEYDGVAWFERVFPSGPSSSVRRWYWHIAYDSWRQRTVLVMPVDASPGVTPNKTWEWDGTAWTERADIGAPGLTHEFDLAFDAVSGRLVLFGGNDGDLNAPTPSDATWVWDGLGSWERLTTSSPGPRWGHQMVFDRDRGVVVLYGGRIDHETFADTWELHGNEWMQQAPQNGPRDWGAVTMAYDSARDRLVFYGASSNFASEIVEWDGSRWERGVAPPPNAFFSFIPERRLLYRAVRGKALLLGSRTGSMPEEHVFTGWEYDGATWTEIGTAQWPRVVGHYSVAYDIARERVVLFGTTHDGIETWEFEGDTWIPMVPATEPLADTWHTMAYDSRRGVVVLYNHSEETWEWDGQDWARRTSASWPGHRSGHLMEYHAARGAVVLFGGTNAYNVRVSDTWEWDGDEWRRIESLVRPYGAQDLVYDPEREELVMFARTTMSSYRAK